MKISFEKKLYIPFVDDCDSPKNSLFDCSIGTEKLSFSSACGCCIFVKVSWTGQLKRESF